jgi:hypothetical protein
MKKALIALIGILIFAGCHHEEISSIDVSGNLKLLQGEWQAIDDENVIVEFKGKTKIESYSEEKITEETFEIYDHSAPIEGTTENENGRYLLVNSDDELFKYKIIGISDGNLELMFLNRGNTLKYKKYGQLIGGETDEHGCLGAAGYIWCPNQGECLRPWEAVCDPKEPISTLSQMVNRIKAYNNETHEIALTGSEKELEWHFENGDVVKIPGEKMYAENLTYEDSEKIDVFFEMKGFELDMYNIADGTVAGMVGYKKGEFACTVIRGSQGYQESLSDPEWDFEGVDTYEVEIICGVLS